MQLSESQKEALNQGRAMPILVDQTECILVRRDVYEQTHAVNGGERKNEGTADKPLEFQWSKTRRKIRAAAKAYSEQTHADY
jgi:hypothetical protein